MQCLSEGIKAHYIGISGKNGYSRGLEHVEAIKTMNHAKNALAKHCVIEHDSTPVEFKMKILAKYKKPLERQCAEKVFIVEHNKIADILINNRSETSFVHIGRHGGRLDRVRKEMILGPVVRMIRNIGRKI